MSFAQRKRWFKPSLFLRFARYLLENLGHLFEEAQLGESLARTVVGRAYYAAFLEAYNKALAKWPHLMQREKRETAEVHALVRDAFAGMGYPEVQSMLGDLCRRRNDADYTMDVEVTRRDAEEALQLSEELIPLIEGV